MKAAAAEMHPDEAFGVLLGEPMRESIKIESVYIYQKCRRGMDKNGQRWVQVLDEEEERIEEFFQDGIVGDFHSHPDETTALSEDDKISIKNDGDGMIALVIAVWPGKRNHWCYRLAGYWNDGGKVRRARIIKIAK